MLSRVVWEVQRAQAPGAPEDTRFTLLDCLIDNLSLKEVLERIKGSYTGVRHTSTWQSTVTKSCKLTGIRSSMKLFSNAIFRAQTASL
jgi:hypothetical protein